MKAKGEKPPFTAPCTYCGRELSVEDDFTLDHTKSRKKLTYSQIKSEKFLVLACRECNQAKGELSVREFTGSK
jgi:5-methylcytosine-specific restriction endonuclease McrA